MGMDFSGNSQQERRGRPESSSNISSGRIGELARQEEWEKKPSSSGGPETYLSMVGPRLREGFKMGIDLSGGTFGLAWRQRAQNTAEMKVGPSEQPGEKESSKRGGGTSQEGKRDQAWSGKGEWGGGRQNPMLMRGNSRSTEGGRERGVVGRR